MPHYRTELYHRGDQAATGKVDLLKCGSSDGTVIGANSGICEQVDKIQ